MLAPGLLLFGEANARAENRSPQALDERIVEKVSRIGVLRVRKLFFVEIIQLGPDQLAPARRHSRFNSPNNQKPAGREPVRANVIPTEDVPDRMIRQRRPRVK